MKIQSDAAAQLPQIVKKLSKKRQQQTMLFFCKTRFKISINDWLLFMTYTHSIYFLHMLF